MCVFGNVEFNRMLLAVRGVIPRETFYKNYIRHFQICTLAYMFVL